MKIAKPMLMMAMAVALLGTPLSAQEQDPTLAPAPIAGQQDVPAAPGGGTPESFGLVVQDKWVAATDFTARTGTVQWSYQTFLYFATATSAQWEAAFYLPEGSLVSSLECYYRDTDAANTANVGMWVHSYDVGTETPTVTNITTNTGGAGTPGSHRVATAVNFTYTQRPSAFGRNIYTLIANMPSSLTVALRGCRLTYNRQVSPAPAVATFSDMPTSNPQFRFVEALVAAGVTGGCGGGAYCPNDPVTRGQMAVFLSVALGLHFQY